MTPAPLAEFLIRAVLDDAFRELALSEPERAFEGYDLSEEEREILGARDGRLLGRLGGTVARGEAIGRPPVREPPTEPVETALPRLPEVQMSAATSAVGYFGRNLHHQSR